MKHLNKGFTLIELLVVIAIIGILSAVVLTSLTTTREKARVAAAQETLHSLQTAGHGCLNDSLTMSVPTETVDGGAVELCAGSGSVIGALPTGWIYCDDNAGTQSDTDCGDEVFAQGANSFTLVAESNADAQKVTCSEVECITAEDSD